MVLCLRKKKIKVEEKQIILYRNPIYDKNYRGINDSTNGYITIEESPPKNTNTLYQQIDEDNNSIINFNVRAERIKSNTVKEKKSNKNTVKEKNSTKPLSFLDELKLKIPEYTENVSI